jgi:hypothetical protein
MGQGHAVTKNGPLAGEGKHHNENKKGKHVQWEHDKH